MKQQNENGESTEVVLRRTNKITLYIYRLVLIPVQKEIVLSTKLLASNHSHM